MFSSGIIVSIQKYTRATIQELAKEAIEGGAVAIRTDKQIDVDVPIIGLKKIEPVSLRDPYITCSLSAVKEVNEWADMVAIDYRKCNDDLGEISEYCYNNKIGVIADIETIQDYNNIKEKGYYYTYIATTLSVLGHRYRPNISLLYELKRKGETMVIAEGNYTHRGQVREAYTHCNNVCIGSSISDINKLTRKYTSVRQNNYSRHR